MIYAMAERPDIPATPTLDGAATLARERGSFVISVPGAGTTPFIRISGDDAVTFLDGIITQDIAAIPIGSSMFGLFLTNKAKIIAPALVFRAGEHDMLLEVPAPQIDDLMPHLRRYRLRARAEIEVVERGCVSLVGSPPERATSDGWFATPQYGGAHDRTLIGDPADVDAIVKHLVSAHDTGIADTSALEAIRIERGTPSLADFMVDAMPAEVGGDDCAVSFTKGCYLGQEPVARLHWRGRAQRTLRRVVVVTDAPEELPDLPWQLAPYGDATRSAGHISSWAKHPDGRILALGSIRQDIPADAVVQIADIAARIRTIDASPA